MSKSFMSIDEQISLLKSRGLIIEDDVVAKDFLLKNNYYRISGYSLTLRKQNKFYQHATLKNIMDIYNFDYQLRHLLLQYLEIIEVSIKSVYAYEFTKVHGPTGYLDEHNFTNSTTYHKTINNANTMKEKRLNHEAYLKHFVNELNEDIPLWAYIDLFTFSDISFLYSITTDDIQKSIAKSFNLNTSNSNELLRKFLRSLTLIRNLCAHGGRLFNRLFEQKPSLRKQEQNLLIKLHDGQIDNSHLYGFIFILKRLLSKDDFSKFKVSLKNLSDAIPFVSMKYYGFRDDWRTVL